MNSIRYAWYRFRSAVTGKFVSKEEAERNPDTTVKEKVDGTEPSRAAGPTDDVDPDRG